MNNNVPNSSSSEIAPDKCNVDNYFSRVSTCFSCTIMAQYNTRHLGEYARNISSPLYYVGCVCLGLSSHYEL